MTESIWIRRDRDTGREEITTYLFVKNMLHPYYKSISLAMKHASKEMPLTSGFADYYPKEK